MKNCILVIVCSLLFGCRGGSGCIGETDMKRLLGAKITRVGSVEDTNSNRENVCLYQFSPPVKISINDFNHNKLSSDVVLSASLPSFDIEYGLNIFSTKGVKYTEAIEVRTSSNLLFFIGGSGYITHCLIFCDSS